ncbi:papilin isoform X4 [Bombyx mori]|uniref:Hemolin n=1 Tax=Bombyx mori TaxID=7091 RepID=A0A8R2RBA5_BOMMO|nr:papilin isoform X4 [Bombyx mori]
MLGNLRSLLLAAIVISNCITWTASRHHYTHNVSRHRSRHRRQGAGLYLSASYVLPGGEGNGWGEWGDVTPCSRTCGGGVASQKRICLEIGPNGEPQCTGGDTKYFSCETQDCPENSLDFRAEQCAQYNNVTFRGKKYRWVPYLKVSKPCELTCMQHGDRFYYRHKEKVIDGTRCNDDSFDVCVDGVCQPVGCDMMLGSNAKEDKCRQCRGNGHNCHTTKKLINTQDLRKGYNDILLIPEGATTIYITEIEPSNNYLALRSKNGTYYLNGDYHIDFPRSMTIAGALWNYERNQQGITAPDKLRSLGPINEPLYLSLLLIDENVGVEYEYSLPIEKAPLPTQRYSWVHGNFSSCSATCGGGIQSRDVTCRSREELEVVDEGLCDDGLKPATNQTCNTQACPPQWVPGNWSRCSKRCGKDGTRSREVRCEKIITNGLPSVVDDKECFDLLGPKPALYESCNVDAACPTWFISPWKPCDKLCGSGQQTRQVVCYQKNNGRINVLSDDECSEEKPLDRQPCELEPCEGVDWMVSEWTGCDTCLATVRSRVAQCVTKDYRVVNSSFCSYHPTPALEEPCDKDKLPACQVQWYATQWSKCSVECGVGKKTRRVFCGKFDGASVMKVDDSNCPKEEKYNDSKPCEVPEEKCPSKWYAAPWSECTKSCGKGLRFRSVVCLRGGKEFSDCPKKSLPDSAGSCNEQSCEALDKKSTPIIDEDYELYNDCIEEEGFEGVNLEADTNFVIDETMFSDQPAFSEGSGYFTSLDLESTFPEIGSGTESTFSTDELLTVEGSGYSSSDTTFVDLINTSETEDVTASTQEETTESGTPTSSVSEETTESGTPTSSVSEETTESGTPASSVSEETTESGTPTSSVSEETTESGTPTSSVSEETTESGTPTSSVSEETTESGTPASSVSKETTESGTPTSSVSEETTESGTPTSSVSEETTESGTPTSSVSEETTESGTPTSSVSEETTESGTPTSSVSEETTESGTPTSSVSEETTESGTPASSVSEETTESGTPTSSVSDETTESGTPSSSVSEETTESGTPTSSVSEETTESGTPTSSISEETTESGTPTSSVSEETTESGTPTSSVSEETTESGTPTSSVSEETTESGTPTSSVSEETTESGTPASSVSEETTESGTPTSSVSEETTESGTPASSVSEETTESGTPTSSVSEETTESGTPTSSVSEETTESGTPTSSVSEETTESGTPTSSVSEETTESGTPTSSVSEETTESGTPASSVSEETTESGTPTSSVSDETTESGTPSSSVSEETTESGTPTSSVSEETTESGTPTSSISEETTESGTVTSSVSEETTESGTPTSSVSEETTESGTATSSVSEETTESGTPASSVSEETTESGTPTSSVSEETTESGTPTSSVSEETTESGTPTSSVSEETTESGTSTSSVSEGTTESVTVITGSTEESSTANVFDESEMTRGVTLRNWAVTFVPGYTKRHCRRRNVKCATTKFGCCPDKRTAASGPFDEGCEKVRTCKETRFGCCSDGVSAALGPEEKGCPPSLCAESLFGCCLSDNKTAAGGNDQEGCPPMPPACKLAPYGCCADGETEATGPDFSGCPEHSTSTETVTETETSSETSSAGTEEAVHSTTVSGEDCAGSAFGCCYDNQTAASAPGPAGCPCNATKFGCCPDNHTPAEDAEMKGCPLTCATSRFGCCPDDVTPAHGPDGEGCCLIYPFGCCPDNFKVADGPNFAGCDCHYGRFGCCPDNTTYARGPANEGCGCEHTTHGCCPDRHTPATGPDREGCGCHTYQFGCCPDGVTISKGPGLQGCRCEQSQYGCCGDGETHATGPNLGGCDCSTSKYGCCPDGQTLAEGPKFFGCTDIPENKQVACSLAKDRGSGRDYSVYWYYDMEYGGCSRFWYGGSDGNGNRFATKEECDDVCVQPSPKDACKLPKVKGACVGYNVRWYYDSEREQCSQFVYGGCLGNANNFDTRELCQSQCEPARTKDQCSLPIERGSCAGNFPRWGFNDETQRCEEFIWGGCEGNSNRFGSEAACKQRCDPPGTLQPRCSQPREQGGCNETAAVWWFSPAEGRCRPFYYSGCGGNQNRFEDEAACASSCPEPFVPDLCTLPAETGECANYEEKWFYDTSEKRCRQFYYGGCGGNENKFNSQIECESRCSEIQTTTTTTTTTVQPQQPGPENSEFCFFETDPGPCTQFETRWSYDARGGRCAPFQYGGCGGNTNNFASEEHCQYYCHFTQDVCQLPMLAGPCNDSIVSWFYDASRDACSQFAYGGCGGNDNRFASRDECESRCRSGRVAEVSTTLAPEPTTLAATNATVAVESRFRGECEVSPTLERCVAPGLVWYLDAARRECVVHSNAESGLTCRNTGTFQTQEACERSCGAFKDINVCLYPLDPGPCRAYLPKYYFDNERRSCQEFVYGGCHGGPNRFSTIAECTEVCKNYIDPCKVQPEPGNCTDRLEKWYYREASDSCEQFVWTGCDGNGNRFETREECEGVCRKQPIFTTTTISTIAVTDHTERAVPDECRTPDSLVPCGENVTVFYYDSSVRSCLAADFGGCRYSNSYRTEEECERRCGAFQDINVCTAQLDPGPCRASIPKIYWDRATGTCKPYAYGGCGGGANRFSSVDECEEVCGETGPETNEVFPDCSRYEAECSALQCSGGLVRVPERDGCERCACAAADPCAPHAAHCRTLYCPYGITNTTDADGCQECQCNEDPCAQNRCPPNEQCVPIAYRDPETQEARYSFVCQPENETNEILPDCDRYKAECARLQCEHSVQRTRTAGGCERCECVAAPPDCAARARECDVLHCDHGLQRTTGPDGCEICSCAEDLCGGVRCAGGERCVVVQYRDPIFPQLFKNTTECRLVNKSGSCPTDEWTSPVSVCETKCDDDADCRGDGKCCERGCSRLCVAPALNTAPPPEPPRAPQASPETEPEVNAAEGGKATLRCIFHGNPPPKITWRKGEITIDGSEGRTRVLSDGTLEIVSLYRNDTGVYICIAENEFGISQQEIHLQVNDPVRTPVGIAGEQNEVITGEMGRPLVLRCLVYGYPTPEIFWYRGLNGPMVPYSSTLYEARENVLLIRQLIDEALGEYACQAYNGEGSPATLLMEVRAYKQDDTPSDNKYLVSRPGEGVHVRVVDAATEAPRPPTVTTTAAPTTLLDLDFNVPLFTAHPKRLGGHHSRTFGTPVSTRILSAPPTLTAGAELSLPCEVDGYPQPENVYWSKDGVRIASGDNIWISGTSVSRLTIRRVTVGDSGVYVCHADNLYSSHESSVQVTVKALTTPAKCTDNPFFADCSLIVRSKFCKHHYYSNFCCKSCLEAGQLSPEEVEMQNDAAFTRRK